MIDHLLGRPSLQFRKIQVLAVFAFWTSYLLRGNPHGPVPFLRRLSGVLSKRLTVFQTVTLTLLYLYLARNFAKLFNLESPEPLANLYTRSYFRATWAMTALDAGFWTAMRIRRKWLRDICSILFTIYYLVAAERADEKVRRVRATITVEHVRVAWEKAKTPYLHALAQLVHPVPNRFAPRSLRIPRPRESVYTTPVNAWVYFEGTKEQLRSCTKIILDFPGGGFVAMSPRHYDDKLFTWSRLNPGIPVVAVDYRKAPEFPYPYALNECYDVYHSIITSRGRVVGLSGDTLPRIALTGDSAGGNFAAGVTLMILNTSSTSSTGQLMDSSLRSLPLPDGLVLVYPTLDLTISSWMTDEQMQLIRQRDTLKTNREYVRRKSEYYKKASGLDPSSNRGSSGDEDDGFFPDDSTSSEASTNGTVSNAASILDKQKAKQVETVGGQKPYSTRLAMTSRLSYFNDRILTPEMMRAMVILYVGPKNRPDFTTDFLLSPLVAPESLLARFPKIYFLTGERDPLVDDTVIMAGRIRAAKNTVAKHRQQLGLAVDGNLAESVEVSLISGISHGFLQMTGLFPQAQKEIDRCARRLGDILRDRSAEEELDDEETEDEGYTTSGDDEPLEMGSATRTAPRKRKGRKKNKGSAVSLGSEEHLDLVGRRMEGLAGGLTSMDSNGDA